jgi:hypothetical protein
MLHNITVLISNRADEKGGAEHAAILAAVAKFRTAVAAFEGGFDLRQRHRVGAARHQEIEALAEHLFPVVSG